MPETHLEFGSRVGLNDGGNPRLMPSEIDEKKKGKAQFRYFSSDIRYPYMFDQLYPSPVNVQRNVFQKFHFLKISFRHLKSIEVSPIDSLFHPSGSTEMLLEKLQFIP